MTNIDSEDPPYATRRTAIGVRLARFLGVLVAIALLVGSGAAYAYFNRFDSKAGGLSGTDVEGNSDRIGNGSAQNILVVGNDSRDGYTDEQLAELSTTGEETLATDTIMLIHVPANGSKLSIISFPRDTYVGIPGHGKNRINAAYANGYTLDAPDGATEKERKKAGQDALIKTVSQLTGWKVDHYVEVSLLGFYNLTNALGGIEVDLCQAAKDPYSGTDLPAGKSLLNGKQALSFVRQRHGLEEYGGDLARVKRQQYFFGAVIREVLGQDLLDLVNIGKLTDLVDALAGTITYDTNLDPLAFAEQMRNIAAGNVQFFTLPLAPEPNADIAGVGSILLPAEPKQLTEFFTQIGNQEQPTTEAPSSASSPSDEQPAPPTTESADSTTQPTATPSTTTPATAEDSGCIN